MSNNHSPTQKERIAALISAGILDAYHVFVGLTDAKVRDVVDAGHGDLLLLVRFRATFDDRRTMTAAQILHAPQETQETIRDVFVLTDVFPERKGLP